MLAAVHSGEQEEVRLRAAMMASVDEGVGMMLAELEKQGVLNNTLFVLSSDNGGERFSDTWPFSGKKTELLEGGLRVPAIVRWPGRVPAGTISRTGFDG